MMNGNNTSISFMIVKKKLFVQIMSPSVTLHEITISENYYVTHYNKNGTMATCGQKKPKTSARILAIRINHGSSGLSTHRTGIQKK